MLKINFMLSKNNKNIFLIYISIIFIGLILRLYNLNFENYWLDELIDFWVADPNISHNDLLLRRELIDDQTPFLFQLLLKGYFELFGYNPEIGRQLPLIFGVLSIPFFGILSLQVSKNNSFLLSVLLISINIYLIKYSQETRVYSLVFLLSTINLILYNKITTINLLNYNKIYYLILFIFISIISLTAHPFTFILLFSQIAHYFYSFFIFKKRNYLFIFSIPIILAIYLIINYNYLLSQLGYSEYFLSNENW